MGSTCYSNKGNISFHSRARRISEQSLGRISLVGIRILYQINNIDPNLYILEIKTAGLSTLLKVSKVTFDVHQQRSVFVQLIFHHVDTA